MRQIRNYGDDRNKARCVYCAGPIETRDHVPSKVLLDEPYPDQLPVVPACLSCNDSFSKDEAYLACLIECTLAGGVDACKREKVRRMLDYAPALAQRLRASQTKVGNEIIHLVDEGRVRNVIMKLARGHIAYEQNEPQCDSPVQLIFRPLITLSENEREAFEQGMANSPWPLPWPEVGSRLMFRVVEGHDIDGNGWITVQEDRYRYRVEGYRVSIVIAEYLAVDVAWE